MTAQDSGISIDSRLTKFRSATTKVMQGAFKDVTAGIAASVVPIANIISFGALLFPDLQTGVPIAIWGMLIGRMPFLGDAVFAPRSAAFPKEKIFEYEIPLASVKGRSAILAGNVATIALWSRLDPDEVIMRVASWAIEE